ncbi:TetR/AcrR family transcriptional regulator [Streptomyces albidoflavus]|uniref:TetR/AcrR family transcriptional regulator n=1 Tax=Streptomyces albidoflavus TaxID=1886 RepID=UPI001C48E48A|nr:TetR/AcrR family transcriptional regulator [Streptomyces albidoflavus]MBV7648496.1 TetR/AcrR family transcriptional regulator [Streptomyces albidoflavus]MBV7709955.1 TetR/AcrR family transcriptional regulator [Streptomyces albidoflavus]
MSEGKGNGKGAGAGAGTSAARARLLATATRIFYAEGIHAVGVDRIVSEAEVTRATLYRHFAGKEELVLACLGQVDQGMRAGVEAAVREAGPSAADAVRAVAGFITGGIRSEGFRGCAFLNAAVEYPDPDHPAHQAVLAHRQWFLERVTELLAEVAGEPAEEAGHDFVMLRDGAMAAGCLSDPELVSATFLRGVDGVLRALES